MATLKNVLAKWKHIVDKDDSLNLTGCKNRYAIVNSIFQKPIDAHVQPLLEFFPEKMISRWILLLELKII